MARDPGPDPGRRAANALAVRFRARAGQTDGDRSRRKRAGLERTKMGDELSIAQQTKIRRPGFNALHLASLDIRQHRHCTRPAPFNAEK